MSKPEQESTGTAATAMPGADALARKRHQSGAEAKVWTDRMLSALENGVNGGVGRKWYSLMDKVFAPKTLALASC
jgi:RNA-directed DNA polymerase